MSDAERAIVLASAGSGKTYRLSGSYLGLLARGAPPERVLATTFTRKAAGEITQRVMRRLVEAADDTDAANALQRETGAALSQAEWARAAVTLARGVERMRVQTLDSFFVTLAQGSASRLGLPPSWRMLSEQEEDALRLEAVDRALEEGGRDATLALLRLLHGGDPEMRVRSVIETVAREGATAYWATRDDPGVWEAFEAPHGLLAEDALRSGLDRARTMEVPATKSGAPRKAWVNAVATIAEALESGAAERALSGKLSAAVMEAGGTFSGAEVEEHHREALVPLVRHARAMLVRAHHDKTRATYALLERTETVLDAMKRAHGAMTFADIPRLLHALDEPDRMRLLERLDARVEHLLLDEYQDTSLEQHDLIEPIIEEIASDDAASRTLVCVGDVKQALYLWREASPEILAGLPDRWETLSREILVKSWRSSPVVLEGVNAVFDDLVDLPAFDEKTIEGARAFQEHWRSQVAQHDDLPGHVTVTSVDASEDDTTGEARLIAAAERASELCDRFPEASIGVLTRTKKGVIPRLLWRLREAGVDASEEGGNPLTDSPPVAVALSALKFAHHPADTMASFHVGTSALGPVIGITDPLDDDANERVSSRLRRHLVEVGPSRLFERWHRACRAQMTERDDGRFAQLVELAARIEHEGGPLDPMSLIDRLRTERVEAPTRARVRLMTIHAAKGLEFDAVILPDLERTWSIAQDRILVDRPDPMGPVRAVTRYPNTTVRDAEPALAEIHARAMRRHVLGELCGLYVAMTRARRALHVIVDEPRDPARFGPRLSDVVRGALCPEERGAGLLHEAGSSEALETVCTQTVEARSERVPLRLRPSGAIGSGALARRAPSSAGRACVPVRAESLLNQDRGAADDGTLIHAAFEIIGWTDEEGWIFDEQRAGRLLIDREGADPDRAQACLERVRRALGREEIRQALGRGRYDESAFGLSERIELWRERSFAARVSLPGEEAPVLMSGRFDRVVVGYAGGHVAWCEVIDFKSERATDTDINVVGESYRDQLRAYRLALVAMTGVHPDAVRTTLVFVDRGRVLTIDHAPDD